jgi:hypothetical protein
MGGGVMKISQLIERLNHLAAIHGDLEVATTNWQSGGWLLDPVRRIRVEEKVVAGHPSLGGVGGLVILPMKKLRPGFQEEWDAHVAARMPQPVVVL